ncbi:hypothetical protein ACRRVA_02620, partial [Candidatus Cardinium hertigii]|uniref:hypothetical protein n=1 Tax=Candidatus Cardinium hertigii TaxID=247481 RepID=UPI003D7E8110
TSVVRLYYRIMLLKELEKGRNVISTRYRSKRFGLRKLDKRCSNKRSRLLFIFLDFIFILQAFYTKQSKNWLLTNINLTIYLLINK